MVQYCHTVFEERETNIHIKSYEMKQKGNDKRICLTEIFLNM